MPGKIFVSFTIVSTSNFFLVAREKDSPAEVYRSAVLTPPHIQRNVTISPVRPVMHSVELWTTVDGVNLDVLRARCDVDASIDTKVSFTPIQFIVGAGRSAPHYDPVADQPVWNNPDITLTNEGNTYNFLVFKSGYGSVDIGAHLSLLPDGHGFEWIDGTYFSADEEYTVMINELVTVPVSGGESGLSYPEDVVILPGNTVFDNTMYNKLLYADSVTAFNLNIADISVIPEGTKFGINTHNSTLTACTIQLPGGSVCYIRGFGRNSIYIGKSEIVQFIKKGLNLFLLSGGEGMCNVGQRITCDGIPPVNSLPEWGGWYLKADYPRLFYWYVNELPVGELGVGTQDVTPNAANATKWIIGSTKFWIPDTRGRHLKGASSSRLANSNEEAKVGTHIHKNFSGLRTGAHGGSSTPANGAIRLLVNTELSGGLDGGTMEDAQVEPNAIGVENEVSNIATNFYRLT